LCVPEGQEMEYRKHYPDADYLIHPDSVVGLSAKIRWVYSQYPNVCMLDDDLDSIRRTYIDSSFGLPANLTSEEAYHLIQDTAIMAERVGAKFFGLASSAKPVAYNSSTPFKLTGFVIGGCVGYLEGFKMELPDECIAACDYFFSA